MVPRGRWAAADSALLSSKLLESATLKVYPRIPHGPCTTHAEIVNRDLLACLQGCLRSASSQAVPTGVPRVRRAGLPVLGAKR